MAYSLPKTFSSVTAPAFFLTVVAGCVSPRGTDNSHVSHHTVHHRFQDAEAWAARFEHPDRDAWQQPNKVIDLLNLAPDAKVADIGAGTGYFPVRFARVAPQGVVYAIDLEPDMVRYLAERAQRDGIPNMRAVQCTADDPNIPEPVDVVFLCNTFHHITDRAAYFARLQDDLTPGGRIAIVDYFKRPLPVGPPPEHKLSEEEVTSELSAAGYRLARRAELPYQYVLVFETAGPRRP